MISWVQSFFIALYQTGLKMAPWLLFGFFAAGVLSLFFSPAFVARHLGKRAGKRGVLLAVLLGVPLPLCSCGVLPVAVGLRKQGASKGAVAAFLSSTPQTGLDSFFATYALLGWAFAWIRPVVAVITGLFGGFVVGHGEDSLAVESAPEEEQPRLPWSKRLPNAFTYAYGTLFGNVAGALFVGLLVSAAILAFVPDNFFDHPFFGSDWFAFPIMLLIGLPMYVCSTASIPVALALMAKGISPGAALIFLIVGPALNAASLTTLCKLLGRGSTMLYLLILSAIALLAGLGLNFANAAFDFLPDFAPTAHSCCPAEDTVSPIQALALLALIALLWHHLVLTPLKKRKRARQTPAGALRVTVDGMRCDHCRGSVIDLLKRYPGVTSVKQADDVSFFVEGGPLPDTLAKDIADLGYTLRESPTSAPTALRVTVDGMRCDHCRGSVIDLLKRYPGVTSVKQADDVSFFVEGGPLPDTLAKDIADLGFKLRQP